MTEENWEVSGLGAGVVDVPLGGVWTAADGTRYRCVGGGCAKCAFLRSPIRVGKTGVETTCANQVDADLNGAPQLACFPFERRDGVGVRFERCEEPEATGRDESKSSVGGRLRRVGGWIAERWDEDPGSVALAVAALVWVALVVARIFG